VLCPINFKFEKAMILKRFPGTPIIAGGTSSKDARRYINQWNEGKIPLLLCHPASLAHGVNLQSGGHIILWYGLTWSLDYYKQLNGRIARQGQKEAVIIHHFVMKNTIDERVLKVLKKKDATQEDFLDALKR
jgi:SNF2 family DNA or RNA helicase